MTDVTWNPAGDDDTSFGPLTAHNVLGGRAAADAHPATAVSYDNTSSGLTADTVQEAIDEVAASGGAVASVNGETGVVVLDAADVGADPAGSAAAVAGDLATHEGLTTTAHGGIVASTDPRLTDARTPTAHEASHHHDGSDPLDAGDVGAVPVESVGLLPGETNRGTWDVAATYAVGDVVFETGSDLYIATAPSTGDQPSLTPGSWDVLDPTGRHVRLGPGATSGDYGTAVGIMTSATGDYGTAVGLGATSGDFGLSVGSFATSGDFGLSVGSFATSGDYEVNVANIYTGTLDPGDPTVATGATIATGHVDLPETADATNPPADHQRLVARTDGLYVRDETGTEVGPLGRHGLTVPLPSAIGFHRRIGSNVAMGRGTVWWIRIPEIAHDAKVTHVWIDTVTGIASCTATGAIVSTTTAGKPGTVLASTAVDAIDMSVSAAVNGAALSSPYTLTTGGNYWVAVLALGGASDPAVRGADGVESWLNVKVGTAPVTPAGGNTYGCLRLTGQASIPGTPAATVGTGTPVVYLSVEAP